MSSVCYGRRINNNQSEGPTAGMRSPLQQDRTRDPQRPQGNLLSPSGFLSLDIFSQQAAFSLSRGNCRSIEVSLLYPPSSTNDAFSTSSNLHIRQELDNMEHSLAHLTSSRDGSHVVTNPSSDVCRFLNLPIELRLKIYDYLLPPRTHTIVTQYPLNGSFYSTPTIPQHASQSFYSVGGVVTKAKLTTYKALSTNFRPDFPTASIYPEILRVCSQIRDEAEPTLYGASNTVFDFGIHLDALLAFFNDRSSISRKYVRNIRIAREAPGIQGRDGQNAKEIDDLWVTLCGYLRSQMPNLRTIHLTIWSSTGSNTSFPSSTDTSLSSTDSEANTEADLASAAELARQWKEWDWARDLVRMESLRQAKVTWWNFQGVTGETGEKRFDSWLASRMASDKLVRDRMIKEGVVIEGTIVLPIAGNRT